MVRRNVFFALGSFLLLLLGAMFFTLTSILESTSTSTLDILDSTSTSTLDSTSTSTLDTLDTKMNCLDPKKRSCHFQNLYFLNGEFHAFLPSHPNEETLVFETGIGHGSPSLAVIIHAEKTPSNLYTLSIKQEPAFIFSIMWNNFMRTIYAGAGVFYTLASFSLPQRSLFVLHEKGSRRFDFLFHNISQFGTLYLRDLPDLCFRSVVVGISPQFPIQELRPENPEKRKKRAFQEFVSSVKANVLRNYPLREPERWKDQMKGGRKSHQVTMIKRKKNRLLLNEKELLEEMSRREGARVSGYCFEDLDFAEQVRIISESDILIGMHGAGMAHLFFLRPGSTLIEIFPYKFRKSVYQNFAHMIGLTYLSFQNEFPERTFFPKVKGLSKEEILAKPMRMNSQVWRDVWRNQDTLLDIPSFMKLFDMALEKQSRVTTFDAWSLQWGFLNAIIISN